jgi:hypothetical protein
LPALKVLSAAECDLHGTLPAQGKLKTLHPPIITSSTLFWLFRDKLYRLVWIEESEAVRSR